MDKKDPTDKLLEEIRERFKLAQDNAAEVANRSSFIEDTGFENGEMWDRQSKTEREETGRPCIEINKVQGVVKQILGDARQNKIQIKVKPVDNQKDPATAKIFDGIINNIETVSSADHAYDMALGHAVRGGFGYFRVLTKYSDDESFDQDICIERITNPLSVYMDPAAQKLDRSDAKWSFIVDTMGRGEYERAYPKSKFQSEIQDGIGDAEREWISKDTIRVAEYFKVCHKAETLYMMEEDGRTIKASSIEKNGHEVVVEQTSPGKTSKYLLIGNNRLDIKKERKVKIPYIEWYKTNGFEILEGPMPWAGKYIPIVFVPGDEIWVGGKPVLRSAIKWAKDPNRLYNWARSIAVENMASAPRQPWLVTPAMIKGFKPMWDTANKRIHPYLLFNPDPAGGGSPQRQQGTIPDIGSDREAMLASDDIKSTTGKYDASLGAQGNETSGKAINARQRQGDIATFVFIDNLVNSIKHLGRILIDLIPKVYDSERVVRLLNENGSEAWETINREIYDPVTGKKVAVLNDISIGKFDVAVTAGPSYSTKRQESIDGMVSMAQAMPGAVPVLAPEIAKNSDWPGAEEIAKKLEALAPQPQTGPPPPDPMQEIKMQKGALDVEGKQLANTEKGMRIQGASDQQDMRTKQLIIEALQDLGFVPS